MTCLRPTVIPKPGLIDKPMSHVPGSPRDMVADYLVVPCGKCISCLKTRQDNFACRIRAEAESKGSLSFVTLTYSDLNLPLVSTIWRVDKDTGEFERITDPDFVCYSRKEDFFSYCEEMRDIKAGPSPRFIESLWFEDDKFEYRMRITPSVCRKDVQLWIKSCRNHFKKTGQSPSWSYAICSEYGPRTCRPHYHCCLFGLSQSQVEDCARLWNLGFTDVKYVNRVNPDMSDGFTRVSEYIGKYVSKGVFECDSVKCGAALGTRMMSSVGLGSSLVKKVRSYVCGFNDIVGAEYDLDTFWIPSKNRFLSRSELASLCEVIPKRISVSFDGKRYFALPRVVRNKIFYVTKVSQDGHKQYCRPSRLWKMVVDAISYQYAELHWRQFELFLSGVSPGKVAEAVAQFNLVSEAAAEVSESARRSDYQNKLSKSKF